MLGKGFFRILVTVFCRHHFHQDDFSTAILPSLGGITPAVRSNRLHGRDFLVGSLSNLCGLFAVHTP